MDNVIKIDQEDIEYGGVEKGKFTGLKRGANKTVAAKHIQNATVFQVDPEVKKPNPSHPSFTTLTAGVDEKVTEIEVESTERFRAPKKEAPLLKPAPITGGPVTTPKNQ